ncbi:hypothetical protein GC176_06755 [bacterium]|nr:hypothetical protein [bacterium]
MSVTLFREIVRFLAVLEPIQQELETVYANRLLALASADAQQLNALAEVEVDIQGKLRRHLMLRAQILKRAQRQGFKAESLKRLLTDLQPTSRADSTGIVPEQHRQAVAWMKQIEQRSWKLRRDSWVNWTVVSRASRQCQELRQIIATAGERRAADNHDDRQPAGGGTLLDAKV